MTKQRIYAVKIHTPEPKVRLVRAANVSAAIRHVADTLIYAEVATQDMLVSMLLAGAKVEETSETVSAVVVPEHAAVVNADAYTSEPAGLTPVGAPTQAVSDHTPLTAPETPAMPIPESLRRVPRQVAAQ